MNLIPWESKSVMASKVYMNRDWNYQYILLLFFIFWVALDPLMAYMLFCSFPSTSLILCYLQSPVFISSVYILILSLSMCCILYHFIINHECCCWVVILLLHILEVPEYVINSETRHLDLDCSCYSSVAPGKFWGSASNEAMTTFFHILSSSLYDNHFTIQDCIAWASKSRMYYCS
jgi:hypothetical protein